MPTAGAAGGEALAELRTAGAVAGVPRGGGRLTEDCQGGVQRHGVMGAASPAGDAGLTAGLAGSPGDNASPDAGTAGSASSASELLPSDSTARRRRGVCIAAAVQISSGEPGLLSGSGGGLRHRSTTSSGAAGGGSCCRPCSAVNKAVSDPAVASSAHRTDALGCDAGAARLPGADPGDGGAAKLRRRTACAGVAAASVREAELACDAALPAATSESLSLSVSLWTPRRTDLLKVRQGSLEPLLLPAGTGAVVLWPLAAAPAANPGLLASGQATPAIASAGSADAAAAP